MKELLVLLIFLLSTSNLIWAKDYQLKPGVTITKENYKNYLSNLEELFFPAAFNIYVQGLEKGWITIPIIEKRKYPPHKGYGVATKKYAGQCRIDEKNNLNGWVGGCPFPHPKNSNELAWNVYRRRMHPDDCHMPAYLHLINTKGKVERTLQWSHYKKWWVGRVDRPPMGELPGNKGILNSKEALVMQAPFDTKGFSLVKIRYEDIEKEDDNYSYIPAIRRVRRLTGADVTDPLLGSDCVPDDFEVWRQKINAKMTFTILGEKDFLVPRFYGYGKKPPFESFIKGNCFQVEWEIRPLWILEILPNDSEYIYGKRIIYIDKEDGCSTIWSGEGYDQKGRLFRSVPITIVLFNFENNLKANAGFSYYNHLTGHATLFDMYFNLSGIDIPASRLTIKALLKEAR